jgi:hypothetical protein
MRQPPRIATWMLKHFGSGPDNDMLLGDLAEQYQRTGKAMWYWRQALKAIPVSLFKEIRAHKWIAASAILTGWVVLIICELMLPDLMRKFYYFRVAGYHVPYFWGIVPSLLSGGLSGWVIGRFHRSQRTGVLLFAVSVIFMDLWWFAESFVFFYYGGRARYADPFANDSSLFLSVSLLGILLGGGLLFGRSNKVAVEE